MSVSEQGRWQRGAGWLATHIVLGQEVERTKDLVVFKFKALGSLEVPKIGIELGRLGNRLGASLSLELLLTVGILRRRDARASTGPAVVVVRVRRVLWHGLRIVRGTVMEARHGCDGVLVLRNVCIDITWMRAQPRQWVLLLMMMLLLLLQCGVDVDGKLRNEADSGVLKAKKTRWSRQGGEGG